MPWYVTQMEFNNQGTINAVPVVLSSIRFQTDSPPHQRQRDYGDKCSFGDCDDDDTCGYVDGDYLADH